MGWLDPHNTFVGGGNQRVTAIVIDATEVSDADTADFTNFPVLVTHDTLITNASEALDADGSNAMQSDGGDLRFYSDVGLTTRLACEVVEVTLDNTPANSTLEVWVLVPTVDYNDDTTIYMTYSSVSGSETQPATDAAFGRDAVWAGFVSSLRLDSDFVDSTGNGNTLTDTGGTAASVAGPFGNGYKFDPSYAVTGQVAAYVLTGDLTYMGWLQLFSLTAGNGAIAAIEPGASESESDNSVFYIHLDGSSNAWDLRYIHEHGSGSNQQNTFNTNIANDTWVHVAFVRDVSANTVDLYINGSLFGTYNYTTDPSTTGTTCRHSLSARSNGGQRDTAWADVVFTDSAFTAGWIATAYANQNAPGTFATAGTPAAAVNGYELVRSA